MGAHFYWLFFLLLVGAVSGPRTLLHTFAVAFDMLVQGVGWNMPISVTLSARAGLAARNGKPLAAKIICFIFFNPNHCEEAIAADIQRANEALAVLEAE
jgi:hypothetical protein